MSNLADLLERESRSVDLEAGGFERLARRRDRRQRNRRIASGVVALVVVGVTVVGLLRALSSNSPPAVDPRDPFLGRWVSSDLDLSVQHMVIRASGNHAVTIVVHDDSAGVCSGVASTMTGTGQPDIAGDLVIPGPVLTCDDGSEPQALSGPPISELLHDLTFVPDLRAETLTDNFEVVWERDRGQDPGPGPATPEAMWPQTSPEEVRQAQELADAGDPRYTWQVDPALVGGAAPWGAEIFDRFFREVLGWEEFSEIGGYAYGEGGGLYDELVFIRCGPGRTNPLYPDDPEGRGCAPTIDDFRYETAMLTIEQPASRGPSGIWVVTGWKMLQPGEPRSLFDRLDPDFTGRQVEQVAPPSDAQAIALLRAFLGARVDGEGAEQYLHLHDGEEPPSPEEDVPILYATTGGAAYERYEIDRLGGPEWPSGWIDFRIHLFAEDGTVVDQSFAVVRLEDGRLGLVYGFPQTDDLPTEENGRPVPIPYSFLDGEVTFAAAPPWGETSHDRTSTILGGVGRGSASQFTMFMITADPRTGTGCEAGPPAADVDALVRSIRSNPDLEATAQVAVTVGGIDALQMDVVAPGQLDGGDCAPMVLEGLYAGHDRTRLYLLDLPEGMSARTLAISISAQDSEFDLVVKKAARILDTFEFHT
jgi:hypothetical protein